MNFEKLVQDVSEPKVFTTDNVEWTPGMITYRPCVADPGEDEPTDYQVIAEDMSRKMNMSDKPTAHQIWLVNNHGLLTNRYAIKEAAEMSLLGWIESKIDEHEVVLTKLRASADRVRGAQLARV